MVELSAGDCGGGVWEWPGIVRGRGRLQNIAHNAAHFCKAGKDIYVCVHAKSGNKNVEGIQAVRNQCSLGY